MALLMRHCFWCGEELGVYDKDPDEVPICGKRECNREARRMHQDEMEERKNRAEIDEYGRYR